MTYATITDVAARWGRAPADLDSATESLITARLADAERLIIKRIPDLVAQLTAAPPTIDVADVVQVEADAVLRIVRNPEGYLSETDGAYTYQFAQGTMTGGLEIMPSEWKLLGVCTGMTILAPRVRVPECFTRWEWAVWQ